MSEEGSKRRPWFVVVWDDLRGNVIFWLVSGPLLAASGAFVGFAKKAWAIDPILACTLGGCLSLSLIGLLAMWRGKAEWDEESSRKRKVRERAWTFGRAILSWFPL